MSHQDIIKIRYPGAEISVNHYLKRRKDGGYYVSPECKVWKEEFQWLLKKCHLEDYKLPLHVTCSGYFKDARSAVDLSNLSKVINDSIATISGFNDRDFRWHDGERVIGVKEPYLLITISDNLSKPPRTAQNDKSDTVKVVSKGNGNAKKTIKKNKR